MFRHKKQVGLCYLGPSSDYRTNRWRVGCPACERALEPPTTMLARQHLTCENPHCNADFIANYNAGTLTLCEYQPNMIPQPPSKAPARRKAP